MNVALLDAVSVSASILSGSPSAASSIMTLLGISSLLEDYTRKKAKNALSDSLSLNIDKVWRIDGGTETLVPLSDIKIGDTVRARTGSMIPVDGFVTAGSAGVNDSPALAAADVSIAMKDASDIAREVADITLLTSNLDRLVVLRDLSENLFARIHSNYRFISLFNSALILLGIGGVITPVTSALMHNVSTMGICIRSMRSFID